LDIEAEGLTLQGKVSALKSNGSQSRFSPGCFPNAPIVYLVPDVVRALWVVLRLFPDQGVVEFHVAIVQKDGFCIVVAAI
jgi:hypothetical protein